MTKELTVRNLYGIRGEITHRTDSNTIVITGKNRAGKSSFVNAFGHIFAHKAIKGAPDAVHEGQIEGEATYVDHDLGLSFTRKWKNGKMSAVEVRALDGTPFVNVNAADREVAAIAVAISGEHSDEELCLVIIKNGDALDPTSLTKIDEMLTEAHFTGLIDRGRPDMPSVAGIDVLELEDGQVAK